MDSFNFKENDPKNFNTELNISVEEEEQDLELSGFTTAGSFSTLACFVGASASSGSSLSSAGD